MPNGQVGNDIVEPNSNVKIIQTDEGNKDGQNKCPKCGSSDITMDMQSGKLRCNFCRHTFEPEKVSGLEEDASKLEGIVMGSGAKDIVADSKDVITLKCSSCGAEVVIDTASSANARCHWCRNTLSINQQIPNGAIPDMVLPFKIKKEEAEESIKTFVGKRKFFANPTFKKEFTTANIMGVYFPYMVVDANAHSTFIGNGEHQIRSYTVKNGDTYHTYYDADEYHVERDFDITVEGLTVESSKDKLNNTSKEKTNNVINAIMPFDIENAVKWDANYLTGFTSEKRDVNIGDITPLVQTQVQDVARFAANDSLTFYDRGVAWQTQNITIKGQQWKSAYLPVWLYSYHQVKGNKHILHYVAVNARTKETMGSVPIHMPLLLGISAIVEILGIIAMLFVDWDYDFLFLSLGVIFYLIMYGRYRNGSARHHHETETKRQVFNLKQQDQLLKRKNRLSNARMYGANNTSVNGSTVGNSNNLLNNIMESNGTISAVNKVIKK